MNDSHSCPPRSSQRSAVQSRTPKHTWAKLNQRRCPALHQPLPPHKVLAAGGGWPLCSGLCHSSVLFDCPSQPGPFLYVSPISSSALSQPRVQSRWHQIHQDWCEGPCTALICFSSALEPPMFLTCKPDQVTSDAQMHPFCPLTHK
jgi:hypothetical protein